MTKAKDKMAGEGVKDEILRSAQNDSGETAQDDSGSAQNDSG